MEEMIENEAQAQEIADQIREGLERYPLPPGYEFRGEVAQLGEEAAEGLSPEHWGIRLGIEMDFLERQYGAWIWLVSPHLEVGLGIAKWLHAHMDELRDVLAVGGAARGKRYSWEKKAHTLWQANGMPGPAPMNFVQEFVRAVKNDGDGLDHLGRWFQPRDGKGGLVEPVQQVEDDVDKERDSVVE